MTTTTTPTPQPAAFVRGGVLDALRFLASMFVVLFHFGDEAPVPLASLHSVWARGYLATDFFLVLSGFVLARAYGAGQASGQVSPLRFWLKRFARSYPTHLITLAILALLVLAAALIGKTPVHAERFDWSGIPAQILLLHAFGVGGEQWNIPAWTLSALLICYAFFPWLWRAMRRLPGPMTALTLGLTLLVVGQALSLALLKHSLFDLPFQWAMLRAAPLFVVGLTLARAVEAGRGSPRAARLIALGGAAVLLANVAVAGPDLISLLAICVLVLGCGALPTTLPTTRPIPGAAWGARVSFCLFMTHTITGAVWFGGLQPLIERFHPAAATVAWQAWGLWVLALVAALVAADLYNRLIDAPLQRAIRRRWFSPPAVSAPTLSARPAPRPTAQQSA
ncbi:MULTISPECIES: acyltransferase family protein [unclassified Brevundimonas]|uniref:acyltransferase family protein n=1 Tax=unclassified Brevundimonas TaxID=2622653 RepID=UPI003F93BF37